MQNNEAAKTVVGTDWPLEERLVGKKEFIESYIDSARLSSEKIGKLLGQDETFYYIAWYMLDEDKVVLLKATIASFNRKFPSKQDKLAREKLLPLFPPQPLGLRNARLDKIVRERSIIKSAG